jgi:hypothetical protein
VLNLLGLVPYSTTRPCGKITGFDDEMSEDRQNVGNSESPNTIDTSIRRVNRSLATDFPKFHQHNNLGWNSAQRSA